MRTLRDGRGKAPVEGGEVAYLIRGEGLPVASAHPYTTPKAGHGPLPGFAVVTVWPRGFGESSATRDRQDYGFWRLADDLDAVRRHLGLERWAFWGTSMGGFTALVYALKYQPTLVALILDSTAASHHYRDDPRSIWPKVRQSPESRTYYTQPSWESLGAFFRRTLADQGAPDPSVAWQRMLDTRDWNPEALPEILRRITEFDTRDRLAELRIPTLVLAGELDLQCPPGQARALAQAIPGATLKVYPRTGHGVLGERPPGTVDKEVAREALDTATRFLHDAYAAAGVEGVAR